MGSYAQLAHRDAAHKQTHPSGTGAAAYPILARPLEADTPPLAMSERLLRAATALHEPQASDDPETMTLRPEQVRVFADFADFLLDVATSPAGAATPYGRIVLPPRTGKTVIAGHIISRTRLVTTFIAPTRALVEQTARELSAQLPGVPVGVYFGDRKELVEHGVNVTTYSILQRTFAAQALPEPLAAAALLLIDEAHHSLTAKRIELLRQGFHREAVRVALTATPDYDDRRVLCRYFPALIHEITLEEALDLDLLAPLRMWVAEVDADGSQVRVVAGDYEEVSLGRVMSGAPFFRAVELFRYRPENRHRPALVACSSRQQAYDLHRYLLDHRPPQTPPPALILGTTPSAEREQSLRRFAAGELDTLLQVGVLIEGWNSPRCKLLIDLAPSLSRVRATQKFFRVMTRLHDQEARIYILLPVGLPAWPVLPIELFGSSQPSYVCGELIGKSSRRPRGPDPLDSTDGAAIAGVTLKQRVLLRATLQRPLLDRACPGDVLSVLRSCPHFSFARPCNLFQFRGLWFEHRLFQGRGEFLLRWLAVPATREAYVGFLARLRPDSAAAVLLAEDEYQPLPPCRKELRDLWLVLRPGAGNSGGTAAEWRAAWETVTGWQVDEPGTPETQAMRQEEVELIAYLLSLLDLRSRRFVAMYYGLLGQPEHTQAMIADDISEHRVAQIIRRALSRIRANCRLDEGRRPVLRPRIGLLQKPGPYRRGLAPPLLEPDPQCGSGWVTLETPIVPRQLPRLLGELLARLGQPRELLAASPSLERWLANGVEHVEARWEAGGQRLRLLRYGHVQTLHTGGENVVESLEAEVNGLLGQTRIGLQGPPGELRQYFVEGPEKQTVTAVWETVLRSLGGE